MLRPRDFAAGAGGVGACGADRGGKRADGRDGVMDPSTSSLPPEREPAPPRRAAPPIVVLAGSDPRPAGLTEAGQGFNPLTGYKGATLFAGGRPLIQCVLDRLAASKRFSDRYVAGPARIFSGLARGARLVDCDGRIDANLRAAFHAVRESHPHGPIAFFTCDVLPDPHTLDDAMDRYAAAAPCDVFFPLVDAPEEPRALGASAWKPLYRVRLDGQSPPRTILPGHLVIVDPDALRLGLVFQLMTLSYRTRNRPIDKRRYEMFRGLLGHALWEDLRLLLTLRIPELTATLIADGAAVAMGLKSGNMTIERLESAVRRVVVSYGHRRRYPRRRVHLPVLFDALSLARDVDTEEEAREAGLRVTASPSPREAAPRTPRSKGRTRVRA